LTVNRQETIIYHREFYTD